MAQATCGFGAVGDGCADAAPVLQQALDRGGEVHLPAGLYRIGRTLRIGSDTRLRLAPGAVIRLADGAGPAAGAGGFLLTNRDPAAGDRNIAVEGGVWDGNNPGNPRGPDGPRDSYTGVALNFTKVRGLVLRGLTVRDPESFFLRIGETRDFAVEDMSLEAPHARPNQDGVHLGGFCGNGAIRRIRGVGALCPNDDMVALNASDDVTRAINLGMREGPIRGIEVEDITAEDAYTFVRILSQDAPVEDVRIRGIRGGCRYHALNLNRWRFPPGKGRIARVRIEDLEVVRRPSRKGTYAEALVHLTLAAQDLEILDFRRPEGGQPGIASLDVDNGMECEALLEGLDAAQCHAVEACSTAVPVFVADAPVPGRCGLRVRLGPGRRLTLPSGGFSRFRLRSGGGRTF